MSAAVEGHPEWLFNEEEAQAKGVGFGIGDNIANERENEKLAYLQDNLMLLTTLQGPKSKKDFRKCVKQIVSSDKRDIVRFYNHLNCKPLKGEKEKLDEEAVVALIKGDPDLCLELFRFEAFGKDLLHPLSMLCALGASTSTLKVAFKACEAALFHDESKLGAPIHYVVTFNGRFDLVRWLVKKDCDALQIPNRDEMTPLHLACLFETDAETVAFLTDRCPEAARMVDKNGMTPLHLACSVEEPQLSVIEDLTEVFADACLMVAKDGSTPLLQALTVQAEHAVLKDLIVSNPKSTEISNPKGSTPLHIAIEQNVDVTVLKDLIRAGPRQLQLTDGRGNLPVHTAVESDSSIKVFQLLARKYPDALETENAKGLTATALAEKLDLDDEIVEFLNPYEEVDE